MGALNLPLNESQLGVDNYRGVHPLSLISARDLFELVLERIIHIQNPFLFKTKAQMCEGLPIAQLAHLVPQTVSCDGFAQRVTHTPQCGACTSCILRRQSLLAAGLAEYDTAAGYRFDAFGGQTVLASNQGYGLWAMLDQVVKLSRCLSSHDLWRALPDSFPQLAQAQATLVAHGDYSHGTVRTGLLQMYAAYIREWKGLPVGRALAA